MRTLTTTALLAACALLGAAGASASSAASAGTSGAQFLKLGSGARAGAMAEAFTAVADDAFAAYYNPAGLARLERPQLGGAHSALFQGVSYQSLTFVYPFGHAANRGRIEAAGSRHALGFGIYYLGIGDIERRTGDSTLPSGTFNSADAAYAISYAYAPSGRLSLGVTGKYISQTLDTYSANAFAADLGALYRLNPRSERPITAGVAARHIGSRIGYVSTQTDPLPTTVVVGLAAQPTKAFIADLDLGKARDGDLYVAAGAETRKLLSENMTGAFRFGYTTARKDNEGLNGISAGAGLAFPKAAFDFAWTPFGTLGNAFRFSLLVKF